ncbi:hypothetical protein [Paraburkholderia bonniea]|uniref:hypothetical protein n=1 Tax=Paraburkholderia bonniea TaxID=2152891 RepID=UPI001290ABCC|nr:hypothetical protein [Paraburkholderia bonniea]
MAITFLGLDKEHWDFINSFANWIAAFGTVGAVIVSLWLALRPERVRLKVTAMIVVVTGGPGGPAQWPRYVGITATNTGQRGARVLSVGWVYQDRPKGKPQHLYQKTDSRDGMSSPLPVTLSDGEQASWYTPISPWLDNLPRLEPQDWRQMVDTFRLQVYTSLGQTFEVPIGDDLKARMSEVFEKAEADSTPPSSA